MDWRGGGCSGEMDAHFAATAFWTPCTCRGVADAGVSGFVLSFATGKRVGGWTSARLERASFWHWFAFSRVAFMPPRLQWSVLSTTTFITSLPSASCVLAAISKALPTLSRPPNRCVMSCSRSGSRGSWPDTSSIASG